MSRIPHDLTPSEQAIVNVLQGGQRLTFPDLKKAANLNYVTAARGVHYLAEIQVLGKQEELGTTLYFLIESKTRSLVGS